MASIDPLVSIEAAGEHWRMRNILLTLWTKVHMTKTKENNRTEFHMCLKDMSVCIHILS